MRHDLGGGGAYNIIYFLTRLIKPKIIFETGVGAGYSTYAFLTAIKENNLGTLYSSDFPYFRLNKPERYIGFLVTDDLIGLSESKFRFVKKYASTSKLINSAVKKYKSEVIKRQFPKAKHSFKN